MKLLAKALFLLTIVVTIVAFIPGKFTPPPAIVGANSQHSPAIYLEDAKDLVSKYKNQNGTEISSPGLGEPLSLVSADFDSDGINDLAVGYAAAGGGALAVYRGNLDAFAPQSLESFNAIAQSRFPSPFLPDVQLIQLPARPDFLAIGNFNGGHQDLIFAARGESAAYVLPGDGKGKFLALQKISLPGPVTGLAAGTLGTPVRFSQVLIGATRNRRPELLLYSGSDHGLVQVAGYILPAAATAFDFGNLDEDRLLDAVILAGDEVLVLHSSPGGAKPVLETLSLPLSAGAVALGRFVHDRDPRLQIAVLASDGSIHIVAHNAIDSRAWTSAEWKLMSAPGRRGHPDSLQITRTPWAGEGWRIVETFPGAAPFSGLSRAPLLLRARISDHGQDDIMAINGQSGQLGLVFHPNLELGANSFKPGQQITRPYATGVPIAAVSTRVNVDARPGIIVLHQGQVAPSVMMPLPDPTFNVNTTNDTSDANPGDGVCADSSGKCSLRAAIQEANALNGSDTIMVPAGTYTLTQGTELDITDAVSIVGASASTTFVQAGTAVGNGKTKVFSVNPGGNSDSFAASLSGMTIRYGNNTIDSFGGASDFDTGLEATGTLSITSCVITQNFNMTSPGDGGGLYLSNFFQGSGSVTISNSTISNNGADDVGGGLYVGSGLPLTLSSSTVSGNVINDTLNNVTVPGGGGLQQGAGIAAINPSGLAGQTVIQTSTISGNKAVKDGGGIFTLQGMLIEQGTVITGNTAGGNGAGLWSNTINETTTVSQSTITGNTATGNGGGVEVDTSTNGNNFNMIYSRIAGNKAANGNGLNNVKGSVTATDNWWGCNAGPGSVPGSTTISVFNTGVTASGSLAADGATDLHYTLTGSPDSRAQGPGVIIANSNAAPIPPWMSNGPHSKWLAPLANANTNLNPGAYVYETTFDLTGLDPAKAQITGQWAAPVDGVLVLNGIQLSAGSVSGATSFTSFTISSGFINGLNTLDFVVTNGGVPGTALMVVAAPTAPTGVRVEVSGSSSGTAFCDLVNGTATAAFSPWITLKHTPSPSSVVRSGSTTLTASVLQDSSNNTLAAGNLGVLIGQPVTFTSVNGNLTNRQAAIQSSGTATATLTDSSVEATRMTAGVTLDSATATASLPVQDLIVNVSPSNPATVISGFPAATVTAGGTANYQVYVTPFNGLSGTVNLSLTNQFPSSTATFNPASLNPGGASTLSVATSSLPQSDSSISSGEFASKVQASAASFNEQAPIALVIADFFLSLGNTNPIVLPGNSTFVGLSASTIGGFTGNISLSMGSLPAGVTAAFQVNPFSSSSSSGVTFTAGSSTAVGSYPFTVTGTSGTSTHTAQGTLSVQNFSVSGCVSETVNQGSSTTCTVTVSGASGFTGSVALSASGLPSGVTASFSPTTITNGSGTSTLTINASSSAAVATSTFTITASSGGKSYSIPSILTIQGIIITC